MVDGAGVWVASLTLQALTSPPAPVPITVALVGAFLAAELFFDRALLTTALLLVDNAEVWVAAPPVLALSSSPAVPVVVALVGPFLAELFFNGALLTLGLLFVDNAEVWVTTPPVLALPSPTAVPVVVALVGPFLAELFFNGALLTTALEMVDGAEVWVATPPVVLAIVHVAGLVLSILAHGPFFLIGLEASRILHYSEK